MRWALGIWMIVSFAACSEPGGAGVLASQSPTGSPTAPASDTSLSHSASDIGGDKELSDSNVNDLASDQTSDLGKERGPEEDSDDGNTQDELAAQRESFFALENTHLVTITLASAAFTALEQDPYTYVPGEVVVDGRYFGNVGVRLKGRYGSFRELSGKSAFLINFARYDNDSRLAGMKKLALNNMVQDPSGLHEWIAYTLFREADLPASRVAYTWLRVNGEDYGFYAAIEVVDNPHFLSAFFADNDGQLFEGEYGTDLFAEHIADFDRDAGVDDGKLKLYELVDALDAIEASPEDTLTALGEVIDLDRYLAFAATEIWLGHWDGYAWTRNNYFIYQAEAPQARWTWMPWGMDQTLRDHLPPFGGEGRISQLCNANADCRAQLGQHFRDVSARALSLKLIDATYAIEAQIWDRMLSDPRREHDTESMQNEIESTRYFLADRAESIEAGLACLDPESVDSDGDGYSGCGEDCDDDNPDIHPNAVELCNVRDDNCNGDIDEGGECPSCVAETFNGNEYRFCFNPLRWSEAREACLAEGGDLVSIHNEATQQELFAMAMAIVPSNWWLGLNDREEEGDYAWSDGTPFDFEAWAENEPNNANNEDCVHWAEWSDGQWNDLPCDATLPYVCKL